MTVNESLMRKIEQKLDDLQRWNQMSFDYWLTEICDDYEELIPEKCTEEVLTQITDDLESSYEIV